MRWIVFAFLEGNGRQTVAKRFFNEINETIVFNTSLSSSLPCAHFISDLPDRWYVIHLSFLMLLLGFDFPSNLALKRLSFLARIPRPIWSDQISESVTGCERCSDSFHSGLLSIPHSQQTIHNWRKNIINVKLRNSYSLPLPPIPSKTIESTT